MQKGAYFCSNCMDTMLYPPKFVNAWISAANVNELISSNGFSGEIDLLSLDIDGVDWWIWKAINSILPRVVVLEFQDIIGDEKAITGPHSANFNRDDYAVNREATKDYCGASLQAFVKLGKQRGCRLIGVERYGYSAFFMRDDVGKEFFPEVAASSCLTHPKAQEGLQKRWPRVSMMEWIEV